MTLTEFLLARIAEDEQVAATATAGPWEWHVDEMYDDGSAEHSLRSTTAVSSDGYRPYLTDVVSAHGLHTEGYVDCEADDRAHIARHDPARVLAECEAKRAIVEMFEDNATSAVRPMGEGIPRDALALIYRGGALASVMKCLALPYADHPDYRDEWRP